MCDLEAAIYTDYITETSQCKTAAIVISFFTYITYLGVHLLVEFYEHKKRDEKFIKIFRDFKEELSSSSYFFLVICLFNQILNPEPFTVSMLYIYYFVTFPLVFLGYYNIEKFQKLRLIGYCLQTLLLILTIFCVLINPWCKQYFFRYLP
jgi:hypothetical protein